MPRKAKKDLSIPPGCPNHCGIGLCTEKVPPAQWCPERACFRNLASNVFGALALPGGSDWIGMDLVRFDRKTIVNPSKVLKNKSPPHIPASSSAAEFRDVAWCPQAQRGDA